MGSNEDSLMSESVSLLGNYQTDKKCQFGGKRL